MGKESNTQGEHKNSQNKHATRAAPGFSWEVIEGAKAEQREKEVRMNEVKAKRGKERELTWEPCRLLSVVCLISGKWRGVRHVPRSLFWWWPPSGLVDSGNRLCDAIAAAVRHVSYIV